MDVGQRFWCHSCESFIPPPHTLDAEELECSQCTGCFVEFVEDEHDPSVQFSEQEEQKENSSRVPRIEFRIFGNQNLMMAEGQDEFMQQLQGFLTQQIGVQFAGADVRFSSLPLSASLQDYGFGQSFPDILEHLRQQDPNRYGRPPAPESSIQAIPELPFTESMQRDTDGCAVCQDPFELESMVSKLPCKHIYHKECILPWLREHDSCPVCRAFISPQEDPSL